VTQATSFQGNHIGALPTLDDDGFRMVPSLFNSAEVDLLLARLEAMRCRSKAGARHLMSHPEVAAVARDERMLHIARQFVGLGAEPFRATLFDKSPASNWLVAWHQDTALPLTTRFDAPGWGPWSVKEGIHYAHAPTAALNRIVALRLHLDDSTEWTGPLRVIAGSHRLGVLSDDEVHAIAQQSSPLQCLTARGGVLAMRPLVIHASSKSNVAQPRRVLHIEYAKALMVAPDIKLAVC
jgi:hypothetical protein